MTLTVSQILALLTFTFTGSTIATAITIVRRNPMRRVTMTKEQATAYRAAQRTAAARSRATLDTLSPPVPTKEPV